VLHNFLPKQVTFFSFILKYKNEKYFSDLQLFMSLQCVHIFLIYYLISIILCMVKKVEIGYMNVGKVATHIIKVRTQ
jgi:hypothetical protein